MGVQAYQAKDYVPLPPPDAEVLTTACDYCIVACGYKAYRWPVGKEGGPKASQNALKTDFPTGALSGNWISPNQHNVVMYKGRMYNVVIKPDADTEVVNVGGDHSIRGGCIAQRLYNPTKPTHDRLRSPMIRVHDTLMPVDWDTALDVAAEVSKYVIERHGESAWAQKQFSYEFYENMYALTKFARRYINTPAWAPHDQPGPGSATAGFRDTGFQNFAPSYWDWGNADTLLISGTDPYETKTIIFNEWILPGIRDRGMKVIMVLPRKTMGAAYAEANGGLFLQIIPGTDAVLQMALTRHIIENGWEDKEWIAKWVANKWETDSGFGQGTRNTPWQWRTTWGKFETKGFDDYKKWLLDQKESRLDVASEITGIPADQIKKAAAMMAKPVKGVRPKTSIGLEKGNYWSNNYLNTSSLAALAATIGTGGRPGQVIGRFGGHQRGMMSGGGYPRMKSPEKQEGRRKKPIDLDRWVYSGHVRFAYVVGTTWTNAMGGTEQLRDRMNQLTRGNPHQVRSFDKKEIIETLKKRVDSGGMVIVNQDLYLRKPIGSTYADIVLPAAGWGEEDFTRNNGERRLRLYSKIYDPPGMAKPDWWIVAQFAKKMGFKGFDWKNSNEIFEEAARFSRKGIRAYDNVVWLAKKKGISGHDALRHLGTTGIQTPALIVPKEFSENRPGQQHVGGDDKYLEWNGLKVIGTVRAHDTERKLPETGPVGRTVWPKWLTHFNSQSGKLNLMKSPWSIYSDFYEWMKPKGDELWVTNGRINEVWQSGFDDIERRPYITQRWPENWLELHPDDAKKRGIENGDYVEVYSNRVPVQKDYNQAVFSGDYQFSSLMKQGHIELHSASVTAVAVVAPNVRKGVSWMYFLHPFQSANSLVAMVPDPITNRYRFKLGVGKVRKLGDSPYKEDLTAMSFARRDIV
ncbi:MAG: molybdopterin-dependent oxidoreductase [Candidatus Nitrospinota bacterium M3_3B_026]